MEIRRIDAYCDDRFSQKTLFQHGAYLIDDEPYEIEITDKDSAVVRGKDAAFFHELIEYFRFHAPHIIFFYDEERKLIEEYPRPDIVKIEIEKIQPSQFYIDIEKEEAVSSFIHDEKDIIIQAMPWNDRYICLDGHTRLYLALQKGYSFSNAVLVESDDWVWKFVNEARKRNIYKPSDMVLLSHEEYEISWNRYCDDVFAGKE
ncbi:MAG: hypothetical protein IKS54_06005 [Erysipelotrichaceae bacterium]|nr:hypothetical protein [Erysipelotrichaceae bacterium]